MLQILASGNVEITRNRRPKQGHQKRLLSLKRYDSTHRVYAEMMPVNSELFGCFSDIIERTLSFDSLQARCPPNLCASPFSHSLHIEIQPHSQDSFISNKTTQIRTRHRFTSRWDGNCEQSVEARSWKEGQYTPISTLPNELTHNFKISEKS